MLRGPGRDRHGRILLNLAGIILLNLAGIVDAGKLRVDDSHFTLETAPDAHRRVKSAKARGKVVVGIAPD
jgi:hypothetical protein